MTFDGLPMVLKKVRNNMSEDQSVSLSKNGALPRLAPARNFKPNKNDQLIIRAILYLSIALLFNVEIRSLGHAGPVNDIGLFAKIWLSDVGLLLPIIWLIKKYSKLLSHSFFIIVSGILFYGLLLAMIRDNPLYSIGRDVRTILGLFCGFSLVMLLAEVNNGFKFIINIEIAFTIVATAVVLLMPGSGFLQNSERLTHPSSFILLDIPLIMFSPAIIYANYRGNVKTIIKTWFCGILLLVNASVVIQTRSTFLTILAGFLFSGAAIYAKRKQDRVKPHKIIAYAVIFMLFALGVIPFVLNQTAGNLDKFIERIKSGYEFNQDSGIRIRLEEIPDILKSMSFADHIFGMGLNPKRRLVDFQGIPYNTMHIGIFNIWWRFGFFAFLIVNILIAGSIVRWAVSLFKKRKRVSKRNRTAVIICTPGLMVAYMISLSSGGFNFSFMIGLGMLYGLNILMIKQRYHLRGIG